MLVLVKGFVPPPSGGYYRNLSWSMREWLFCVTLYLWVGSIPYTMFLKESTNTNAINAVL